MSELRLALKVNWCIEITLCQVRCLVIQVREGASHDTLDDEYKEHRNDEERYSDSCCYLPGLLLE